MGHMIDNFRVKKGKWVTNKSIRIEVITMLRTKMDGEGTYEW